MVFFGHFYIYTHTKLTPRLIVSFPRTLEGSQKLLFAGIASALNPPLMAEVARRQAGWFCRFSRFPEKFGPSKDFKTLLHARLSITIPILEQRLQSPWRLSAFPNSSPRCVFVLSAHGILSHPFAWSNTSALSHNLMSNSRGALWGISSAPLSSFQRDFYYQHTIILILVLCYVC